MLVAPSLFWLVSPEIRPKYGTLAYSAPVWFERAPRACSFAPSCAGLRQLGLGSVRNSVYIRAESAPRVERFAVKLGFSHFDFTFLSSVNFFVGVLRHVSDKLRIGHLGGVYLMVAVLVAALARLGTLELGRRRTEQELAVLGGPECLDLVRQTLNRAVARRARPYRGSAGPWPP